MNVLHYDIVIVGGGAGGLELAAQIGRRLGKRRGREKVLLIDRAVFHIWKPTLHEVAAGTLDTHQEGLSFPRLARRNHFSFALGELARLDSAARRLTLREQRGPDGSVLIPERTVTFRWAVLATGSGSNFFGAPGAERAFALEATDDAERFHLRLLAGFAKASFSESKVLPLAIVGGGATGVELAAELIEATHGLQDDLDPERRFSLDITVVEGAQRILRSLPERVSKRAQLELERKGVRILAGTRVLAIEPDRLVTSAGEVRAELVVWAAGIKASEANTALGLRTTPLNQFVVNDRLETSAPNVYAMGDCAACPRAEGKLVPARAQAAHQQAAYLRRILLAALKDARVETPFAYRDFGSLVSLGGRGIGALLGGLAGPGFLVEGLIAKWMHVSLHLSHHRAILGAWRSLVLAVARLLQERVAGRLKLH
jgi:NADH dehydrogenase